MAAIGVVRSGIGVIGNNSYFKSYSQTDNPLASTAAAQSQASSGSCPYSRSVS
jgi:hypothetical protein